MRLPARLIASADTAASVVVVPVSLAPLWLSFPAWLRWLLSGATLAVCAVLWRKVARPLLADLMLDLAKLRQDQWDTQSVESFRRREPDYRDTIMAITAADDARREAAVMEASRSASEALAASREALVMGKANAASLTSVLAQGAQTQAQIGSVLNLVERVADSLEAFSTEIRQRLASPEERQVGEFGRRALDRAGIAAVVAQDDGASHSETRSP